MSRQKILATLIAASCCLPLAAWAKSELATIVGNVLHNDPVMLEAKARVEEAEYVIKSTRAQHYPTLGLQTAQNFTNTENNDRGALALTGRLNLFSFGAIQSQVKRDKAKRDVLAFKTTETRENLAYTVANLYLTALRAKELLRAEKKNYDRHQTIVDTLKIITKYDPGRRSELAQAQARQLQVRNRMYQYQRTMRVSLAQLKRYVPNGKPTLRTDFEPAWRRMTANRTAKDFANHPGLQAQRAEMQAVHYEMRSQKLSTLPRIDLEVQQAHAFNNRNRQDPVVRVVLNWDFLNLGSRYTAQSYAKQYAASVAREKLLQQELSSRGQMALVDIEETGKQVQSALKQIEASEKVVSMYQLQFKIGRRSLIELLNAHNELASMEITRVNAQNDRRVAMLEWLYAQALLDAWVKQEQIAPKPASEPPAKAAPKPAASKPKTDADATAKKTEATQKTNAAKKVETIDKKQATPKPKPNNAAEKASVIKPAVSKSAAQQFKSHNKVKPKAEAGVVAAQTGAQKSAAQDTKTAPQVVKPITTKAEDTINNTQAESIKTAATRITQTQAKREPAQKRVVKPTDAKKMQPKKAADEKAAPKKNVLNTATPSTTMSNHTTFQSTRAVTAHAVRAPVPDESKPKTATKPKRQANMVVNKQFKKQPVSANIRSIPVVFEKSAAATAKPVVTPQPMYKAKPTKATTAQKINTPRAHSNPKPAQNPTASTIRYTPITVIME